MSRHPARQAYVEEAMDMDAPGVDINNIPTDTNYAITTGGTSQQTSSILNEFARKRKAASLAVPTDDKRVRTELRSRGEPITLFGERPENRRDRLREIMYAEQEGGDEDDSMKDAGASDDEAEAPDEEFYTPGSDELLAARREIAKYSLPRTARRVAFQRDESVIPVATHVKHRKGIKQRLSSFELYASQIAGERAVSMVRFSPNSQLVASGDWSGSIKILDLPNLETQQTLRGHKSMIGGIAWHPDATVAASPSTLNLASGGGEGNVNLWSLEQDTPLASLSGHAARVVRTAFHPSGRYLASASYDTTWRLWDVNTTTELLCQEGHSKEVFTVAFNDDGSLLASAGLDSIGRIWDLRSGRTIMLLDAHIAPIHALDWAPDGVRVLTGSADGFAKCWDLRAVRETATIGAHRGGVSDIKFFRGSDGPLSAFSPRKDEDGVVQPKTSGTFFVSAGFDKAVNLFSADDWALCGSLTGHDGTVLAADVSTDGEWVVSCGRDRSVKLWGRGEGT
nr:hypothetical protein B0A51_15193 [Rachicladosporium sp. CCFEE 5018]